MTQRFENAALQTGLFGTFSHALSAALKSVLDHLLLENSYLGKLLCQRCCTIFLF